MIDNIKLDNKTITTKEYEQLLHFCFKQQEHFLQFLHNPQIINKTQIIIEIKAKTRIIRLGIKCFK